MNKTTVVNLRTSKYEVYIGRGAYGRRNPLGNPHPIRGDVDRTESIRRFAMDFPISMRTDQLFARAVEDARGKVLGCFCKPSECHGDVYVIYHELGLDGVTRVAKGESVTQVMRSIQK